MPPTAGNYSFLVAADDWAQLNATWNTVSTCVTPHNARLLHEAAVPLNELSLL
jgi:hypothetical protein